MTKCDIICGDALTELRKLPAESVQCCVTSPPYWQKRDYGISGQIGLEASPEEYAIKLAVVLTELRRVTAPLGSLWLNLGDSYASGGNGGGGSLRKKRRHWRSIVGRKGWRKHPPGYKDKDLVLAPMLVALLLRDAGWYLRQTIIWWRCVANEPDRLDRPAVSHEYLFLFSKFEDSSVRDPGEDWWSQSVWKIPASQCGDEHPAPMPRELIRRCLVAGSKPGETVSDCFAGRGIVGEVAQELGRHAILIELNPVYCALIKRRTAQTGMVLT